LGNAASITNLIETLSRPLNNEVDSQVRLKSKSDILPKTYAYSPPRDYEICH